MHDQKVATPCMLPTVIIIIITNKTVNALVMLIVRKNI